MRSRHARSRAALAAWCLCDRQGGSRRQLPAERKRRQYEHRVTLWRRDEGESLHSPVRRAVRDALIDARKCLEDRDAEVLFERAEQFRARTTGFQQRYISHCDRAVSWFATRLTMTTRERVHDAFARRAASYGLKHLMAISTPGAVYSVRICRRYWRHLRVDGAEYSRCFDGFLRGCMAVGGPLSVHLARRLHALLHDARGRIGVGPTNRWSGALRWNRTWLTTFLNEHAPTRARLEAWMRAKLDAEFVPWE